MNVLFLTLSKIESIEHRGIYTDLLRKFRDEGHNIFILSPNERREGRPTSIVKTDGGRLNILNVKTFNIQKAHIIEKGIGTLAIEYQYLRAIKKYFSDVKFDLVLYSTPPITFSKVIGYVKKRDKAYCYLLLKDIFPQNAVDMKMLKSGGFLHKMFLKKERKLYAISDRIGCMSPANVDFILKHNPWITPVKVEENPNTIEPVHFEKDDLKKKEIRQKYGVPQDKKVFVYGGNLGVPQGIDFLLETIKNTKEEVFFLVVGSGTEYKRIKSWFEAHTPKNALLLSGLPKNEYDELLNACDVGLIFLHKDFTIPNFPSRLLSYLEMKLPIIAATDANTDIGKVIEENGCGFSVISGEMNSMQKAIEKLNDSEMINQMGENAIQLLEKNYLVERSYKLITQHL